LRAVDEYGIISGEVPVAQWIEHRPPKPGAQVQFLSGTLSTSLLITLPHQDDAGCDDGRKG